MRRVLKLDFGGVLICLGKFKRRSYRLSDHPVSSL